MSRTIRLSRLPQQFCFIVIILIGHYSVKNFALKLFSLNHVLTKLGLIIQEILLGGYFVGSMQGFSQEKGMCILARPSMFKVRKKSKDQPHIHYKLLSHQVSLDSL